MIWQCLLNIYMHCYATVPLLGKDPAKMTACSIKIRTRMFPAALLVIAPK